MSDPVVLPLRPLQMSFAWGEAGDGSPPPPPPSSATSGGGEGLGSSTGGGDGDGSDGDGSFSTVASSFIGSEAHMSATLSIVTFRTAPRGPTLH